MENETDSHIYVGDQFLIISLDYHLMLIYIFSDMKDLQMLHRLKYLFLEKKKLLKIKK